MQIREYSWFLNVVYSLMLYNRKRSLKRKKKKVLVGDILQICESNWFLNVVDSLMPDFVQLSFTVFTKTVTLICPLVFEEV